MNIVVTGCAGFIGSHAAERLVKSGHNIIGIDKMTYAARTKNMSAFIEDIEFYEMDICETQSLNNLLIDKNVDWIINFAAESHVDNSIKDCDRFIHSNIMGVKSLLEVCKKTKAKFMQISTDEVYGSATQGSFNENSQLDPKNPYSATKAAAEHFVRAYHNTYDISYTIVRMSNNFGPRQHKEKLIPTVVRCILDGKKVPVYGTGMNVRDWFYVRDCAAMIHKVLEHGKINETYNLTLNNERTNLEIIEMIAKEMGKNLSEVVEFVKDRPGHDFRYSISNNKVLEIPVIHSKTDMKTAIQKTIREVRNEHRP